MQKPILIIIFSFLSWLLVAFLTSYVFLSKEVSTETGSWLKVVINWDESKTEASTASWSKWEEVKEVVDASQPLLQDLGAWKNLDFDYISSNWRCNLDFLSDTDAKIKEKFLGVIFNDFLVLKWLNKGEYKCFKLPKDQYRWTSSELSLIILNDFWTEFFVKKYTYDAKVLKITAPDFSGLPLDSSFQYYNHFYKDYIVGGRVQEFINKNDISVVNISSKGILLYTDTSNNFNAVEVFDDEFKVTKKTEASQAFLECFNNDKTLQKVLKDMKITNEGIFKNMNIDYKDTLLDTPRFNLNYIYWIIKNIYPDKNTCYKVQK